MEYGEQGFQKVVEDAVREIREIVDHDGPCRLFLSVFYCHKKCSIKKKKTTKPSDLNQ